LDDAVDIIYGELQKPTFRTTPESQQLINELTSAAQEQIEKIKSLGTSLF